MLGPTTAGALARLRPGADTPGALPIPRPVPGEGGSFGDTLSKALDSVDASQKAADGKVEAFLAGEEENLHDVVIAMNEAKLHFQFMTEARNKLLETYQELMRMQV